MTVDSLASDAAAPIGHAERQVVLAACVGAALEWYDFFVFAALAATIASNFFTGLDASTGFIFALLTFAAGFIVRPIGALVFGRMGDQKGRKRTFMLTVILMGGATVLLGALPTFGQIGVLAPALLILLRMVQGFAIGGEYGAAASYVAEHAPQDKRGSYTAWVQTTSTIGLLLSLIVVTTARQISGTGFDAWGWRIPFLFSALLLVISIYIRRSMSESPAFERVKGAGRISPAPLREAFGQWSNVKLVLQGLFGLLAGQAVVWFTALFYTLFFLTQTLKVDPASANLLVGTALVISIPMYVLFGRLSDRIGRKPVILGGSFLAALTIFPIFHGLMVFANPALATARQGTPIVVTTDATACSLQFNPIGIARFTSPCDIARKILASSAANYTLVSAPSASAHVRVGAADIEAPSLADRPPAEAKRLEQAFATQLQAALAGVGYPAHADPAAINKPMVVLLLTVLMAYGAMTLGPISAALVEMFPTRIRYSAMSFPYHIGNGYFGGFLPAICFAIVAETGDAFAGLWYPVTIAAISGLIGLFCIRESHNIDIFSRD
ncbi:MFS transporter [Methylobacterium sp. A49B]